MAKAKPVPDGYHTLTPHLICRDAAKAIDFYKKAFGAEERMRMPDPSGRIMHAELSIGDSTFMLGEENPQCGNQSPLSLNGSPVSLHIYVQDVDKSFDRAVKAGAKVKMPVMDMFWGDRYGQVSDPFGHSWSLATHTKDLTPEEMMKGAKEAFAAMAAGQGKGGPAEKGKTANADKGKAVKSK